MLLRPKYHNYSSRAYLEKNPDSNVKMLWRKKSPIYNDAIVLYNEFLKVWGEEKRKTLKEKAKK